MRRPLKPFVTEYKGTRRQAPSPQASGLQSPAPSLHSSSQPAAFESERSRSKSADPATREDSEDSYEAAMRAADALFARPTPPPAEPPVAASEAVADGFDVTPSLAAPDRGGRILRALDEPPPPQLLALEAAHAPKRRGRKPGSKNKPKIKPVEVEPVGIEPLGVETVLWDAPASPESLHRGMSEDPAPLAAQAAHPGPPALRRLEAIPASAPPAGSPSNGSKRFSWVRDRLKPGEAWKRRRLPRICW